MLLSGIFSVSLPNPITVQFTEETISTPTTNNHGTQFDQMTQSRSWTLKNVLSQNIWVKAILKPRGVKKKSRLRSRDGLTNQQPKADNSKWFNKIQTTIYNFRPYSPRPDVTKLLWDPSLRKKIRNGDLSKDVSIHEKPAITNADWSSVLDSYEIKKKKKDFEYQTAKW